MQDTLNSKKHGDTAFRAKDFSSAIDCYTQVSFGTSAVHSSSCDYYKCQLIKSTEKKY